MTQLLRGVVRAYTAATHKADVQLAGSLPTRLVSLAVATNVRPAVVVAGRECAVLLFTDDSPDDGVVVSVQGANPTPLTFEGTLQTTDGNVTAIPGTAFTLPDNCIAVCLGRVVGRDAATGNSAGYFVRRAVKQHAGGGPVLVGAAQAIDPFENVAAWNASVGANATDVLLTVQGAAAVTIEWKGLLEVYLYVP